MVNVPSTKGAWKFNPATGTFIELNAPPGWNFGGDNDDHHTDDRPIAPDSVVITRVDQTTVTGTFKQSTLDPSITAYRTYINGVLKGTELTSSSRSFTIKNLTPSTNYNTPGLTVVSVNGTGESVPSNAVPFKTLDPVVNKPPAPLTTTYDTVTSSGVNLVWTDPVSTAIAGHRCYANGAVLGVDQSATARSRTFTTLKSATTYQMYIVTFDANGVESDPGPTVTFKTLSDNPSGQTALMGLSVTGTPDHGGYSTWDAGRAYKEGAVDNAVKLGCKIVGLSDEDQIPNKGAGSSAAKALDDLLTRIFNKYPNLIVQWANGNETDGDTVPVPSGYKSTNILMRGVIDKHIGLGHDVSFWVDLTQNNVRGSSDYEAAMKDAHSDNNGKMLLDGIACSFYPPGRTKTVDNPTFNPYDFYIDPVYELAKNWGVKRISCWETGIPDDPNDKQHRPRYAAGMAQYFHTLADTYGFTVDCLLWWDHTKGGAGDPDNRFSSEPTTTNPSTATCWRNWQQYV